MVPRDTMAGDSLRPWSWLLVSICKSFEKPTLRRAKLGSPKTPVQCWSLVSLISRGILRMCLGKRIGSLPLSFWSSQGASSELVNLLDLRKLVLKRPWIIPENFLGGTPRFLLFSGCTRLSSTLERQLPWVGDTGSIPVQPATPLFSPYLYPRTGIDSP
jgi:hypothetical protein